MSVFPIKTDVLIIAGLALIVFSLNNADLDLFSHVTFGEAIINNVDIAKNNTYSYTQPDQQWINYEWLTGVIFALINSVSGDTGLLLFKIAVPVIILILLGDLISKIYPSVHPLARFFVLLIITWFLEVGSNIRAQMFTFLALVFMLRLLLSGSSSYRTMLFLVLLFIPWVNLHGGVIAGYGTFYLWLACRFITGKAEWLRRRKHVLITALILPFTLLINPYGIEYIEKLWIAISMDRPEIFEWHRFNFLSWDNLINKLLFLVIVLLSFYWKKQVGLFPTVFAIVTAVLSILHYRHIPFFGFACALYLPFLTDRFIFLHGKNLVSSWERAAKRFNQLNHSLRYAIVSSYILVMIMIFSFRGETPFGLVIPQDRFPVSAVNWLNANAIKGNVLCSFNWGSYLIRELGDGFKVSIDGRYETAYSINYIREYFAFYFRADSSLNYLDAYPHEWILLESNNPVVLDIVERADWTITSITPVTVLFARTEWIDTHPNVNFALPEPEPEDLLFR